MSVSSFKKRYIGDSAFYKRTLAIAAPMIIQNLITNIVALIDNVMVGRIGTAEMSGVSIVNQFMFVFNITIFGAISGASIFGTQFFGKGDSEGQKYTFRFRLITALLLILIGATVFLMFGNELINLFLSKDDDPELIASTLKHGKDYLQLMIIGLIPFAIGQAYASVVRECGETKIPMLGSFAAIGVNVVLDYCLIFGKFGCPELGVKGAAIATVIAKFIEAGVVIVWTHVKVDKNPYAKGVYKSFYMPKSLTVDIIKKGMPLLFNEFLWSVGMSFIAQSYSVRGIDVVAARNIASTLTNLFNVAFVQIGGAIGIIVGALLGASEFEEAKDSARKLTFFSCIVTAVLGICIIPIAFIFPQIYETEAAVKELATYFIIVSGLAMPIWSYTNACYFTLRSGGKTGITFLFDFVFTWAVMIPLAYVLANFTNVEIHWLYAIVTFSELLKVIVGYLMVKSEIWINNIVE